MASQRLYVLLAAILCAATVAAEWTNGESPELWEAPSTQEGTNHWDEEPEAWYPTQVWNHIGPNDIGLIAPGGAPWGRKLILSGGFDGYKNHSEVNAFNLFRDFENGTESESWTLTPERLEDLFKTRSHHTSNVYRDYLFTFGGAANCTTGVEPLEIQQLRYGQEHAEHVGPEAAPSPRTGHSAIVYDEDLYVFGGFNYQTNKFSGELWRADLRYGKNIRWTKLFDEDNSPIGPRSGHSAILYQDSMYIYGGQNGNGFLGDVWRFDFRTGKFIRHFVYQDKLTFPRPRVGHAAVYWTDESMYVFGGYNDKNGYLNDLWRFDLQTETWEAIFEGDQAGYNEDGFGTPSGRANFAFSVVDGKLVIIGGQVGVAGVNMKFWSPNTRFVPIYYPEDYAGDVWAYDFCEHKWIFIGCLPPWEDKINEHNNNHDDDDGPKNGEDDDDNTHITSPQQCRTHHKPRCLNDCSGNGVCVRDGHCVCRGEWAGEDCTYNRCVNHTFLGYDVDLMDRILIVETILKAGKALYHLREKLVYIQERLPEFEEFTSCVKFHPLIGEMTQHQAGTEGLNYNHDLKSSLLPILKEFNEVLEETHNGEDLHL